MLASPLLPPSRNHHSGFVLAVSRIPFELFQSKDGPVEDYPVEGERHNRRKYPSQKCKIRAWLVKRRGGSGEEGKIRSGHRGGREEGSCEARASRCSFAGDRERERQDTTHWKALHGLLLCCPLDPKMACATTLVPSCLVLLSFPSPQRPVQPRTRKCVVLPMAKVELDDHTDEAAAFIYASYQQHLSDRRQVCVQTGGEPSFIVLFVHGGERPFGDCRS